MGEKISEEVSKKARKCCKEVRRGSEKDSKMCEGGIG